MAPETALLCARLHENFNQYLKYRIQNHRLLPTPPSTTLSHRDCHNQLIAYSTKVMAVHGGLSYRWKAECKKISGSIGLMKKKLGIVLPHKISENN
jgi:hypothetical protein